MTARVGSNDRTNGGSLVGLTGEPVQVGSAELAVVRLSQPVSNQVATLANWTPNIGDPVVNVGWGGSQEVSQQLMELNSTTTGCPDSAFAYTYTCNRTDSGAFISGGDSGGPLLVRGGDGSVQVVGVAHGHAADDPLLALYVSTAYGWSVLQDIIGGASPPILPPEQVQPQGQLPVG
jgi:hypothetical protein